MGFGDRVNLLYVACTRAKTLLSIPLSMQNMLEDCDLVFRHVNEKQLGDLKQSGCKVPLPRKEAAAFYRDIVDRLRSEVGVKRDESLVQAILRREGSAENQLLIGSIDAPCHSESNTILPDHIQSVATPDKYPSNVTKRVANANDIDPSVVHMVNAKDTSKHNARRNLFGDRDDSSKKPRAL